MKGGGVQRRAARRAAVAAAGRGGGRWSQFESASGFPWGWQNGSGGQVAAAGFRRTGEGARTGAKASEPMARPAATRRVVARMTLEWGPCVGRFDVCAYFTRRESRLHHSGQVGVSPTPRCKSV